MLTRVAPLYVPWPGATLVIAGGGQVRWTLGEGAEPGPDPAALFAVTAKV